MTAVIEEAHPNHEKEREPLTTSASDEGPNENAIRQVSASSLVHRMARILTLRQTENIEQDSQRPSNLELTLSVVLFTHFIYLPVLGVGIRLVSGHFFGLSRENMYGIIGSWLFSLVALILEVVLSRHDVKGPRPAEERIRDSVRWIAQVAWTYVFCFCLIHLFSDTTPHCTTGSPSQ